MHYKIKKLIIQERFSPERFYTSQKPLRKEIPIYLAAINKKMVELAWEIGDGIIFYLRPKEEMKKTISVMRRQEK